MILPETCHGAAAALVDAGYSVFPVDGKIPYAGTRGCLDSSRDYDLVDEWWNRWPEAGVAIATGSPSGVWVLDVDGAEGAVSLAELPSLPETVEARTARGHHVYFRMPARDVRNSAGRAGPGLDVRGTGGYVVVPPSPHPSGSTYEWVRDPFNHAVVVAPEWLLHLVLVRPPETFPEPRDLPDIYGDRYVRAAIESECDELARTSEGSRNHRLNTAAYSLARFVAAGKVDVGTVARSLAYAAAQAGLGRPEIEKTIRSAFKARGVA
jgi:hypothetical protein